MRKEEEKRRSIYGDNTNALVKEFKPFAIKRFGEQISLLIISVNGFVNGWICTHKDIKREICLLIS